MSRMPVSDVIEVKPSNNIYTVLVAIACMAQIIALIALFSRVAEIFPEGKGLF